MTYYELLNIKENASYKDIKIAYRALAKKYHPDTYKGNKSIAEEKMKLINEAYDVLSNSDSRKNYDESINANKTEVVKEESYSHESYYNYETGEYKSPDPVDAEYNSYYNYYPYEDDAYEEEYDFNNIKLLFQNSKVKFGLMIIFFISLVGILIHLTNAVQSELKNIFVPINHVDYTSGKEEIPKQVYNTENN